MKLTESHLRRMIRKSLNEALSIHQFDEFTQAFCEALLWSETNVETMEPLDDDYSVEDIQEEGLQEIKEDCEAFQEAAGEAIRGREEEAGHDFCFTRNGHGAGFWDGDWPEHGDFLTDLSKQFGNISLIPIDEETLAVGE